MADSEKPRSKQPQYLPRTWKPGPAPTAETPPAESDVPKKKKKKKVEAEAPVPPVVAPKKKKKKVEVEAIDDGTGGPKLEETPLLDTYEARQRVRLAVGAVLSVVALLVLIVFVRRFQAPAVVATPANNAEVVAKVDARESAEKEAAVLLDSAQTSSKNGRNAAAVTQLQKIVRSYEGTTAAHEAARALDRDRRNRPLFEEEPKSPAPSVPGIASVPAGASAPAVAKPAPPAVPPAPPPIVARSLPNGYKADTSAGLHPSGWPLRITCDRDAMTLVLVPSDEFLMGRDDGDPSERPAHRVRLGTFYIDQHEVTNRQYQGYLKESGRAAETIPAERLDLPAVSMTAPEARSYCQWANRRLPTEAQWELAARSPDGRVGYGSALRGNDSKAPLRPAMSEPLDRSPYGAFDMATNAAEWTSDYFDPKFFGQAGPLSIEPAGPRQPRIRPALLSVKGHSPTGILTDREGVRVEGRQPYLGFRGVLTVETLAAPTASNAGPGPANPGDAGGVPAGNAGVVPF